LIIDAIDKDYVRTIEQELAELRDLGELASLIYSMGLADTR